MGLSSLFKLEKRRSPPTRRRRGRGFCTSFEAMFNPSTYSQTYAIGGSANRASTTAALSWNTPLAVPLSSS